jgi:3-mercaptopyruvate sulfurtransferase SseA
MDRSSGESFREIVRDASAIALLGIALGVVYNWRGLEGRPQWGLAWIAENRGAALASAPPAGEANADPMALGGDSSEIPALDRPIQADLAQAKRLHDADAALFVDAREAEEYAAGHIAGATHLPFDEAAADPERLTGLDTGGRPIVTYCGGGGCELSINLAWELVYAGQQQVLVLMGGYPEWVAAGYPIESGEPRAEVVR